MTTCADPDCTAPARSRGLCEMHYSRQWQREKRAAMRADRLPVRCDKCGDEYHPKRLVAGDVAHICDRCRTRPMETYPAFTCKQCGEEFTPLRYFKNTEKPRNQFCSRACKDKHRRAQPAFKVGARNRQYVAKYGLTTVEVEALRLNGCGICGAMAGEKAGRWNGQLHVDHDHVTGKVRGVLCHGCNVSIGHFNDDPALLMKAIEYLTK